MFCRGLAAVLQADRQCLLEATEIGDPEGICIIESDGGFSPVVHVGRGCLSDEQPEDVIPFVAPDPGLADLPKLDIPGVALSRVETQSIADLQPRRRMGEQIPGEPAHFGPLEAREPGNRLEELDKPIPALGGKSMREACQTEAGRREIRTLISTFPGPEDPVYEEPPLKRMLTERDVLEPDTDEYRQKNVANSVIPSQRTPRNAPCPCGSGRKYKKCCGRA